MSAPGIAFILALLGIVVAVGWRLRGTRRFWKLFAALAAVNLVALNVAPDHPSFGRVLDRLYSPLDWLMNRFIYGIHDPTTMFLLWVAFPFFIALLIEGVIRLSRPVLRRV